MFSPYFLNFVILNYSAIQKYASIMVQQGVQKPYELRNRFRNRLFMLNNMFFDRTFLLSVILTTKYINTQNVLISYNTVF